MNKLKTVIVDDVQLIRAELKSLLSEHTDIKVIGEASNGKTAIKVIKELKPDVVFLDIQMPVLSGFQMLETIDVNFKVILISSFNKYMPEAQKYNIVDFLMKPINKRQLAVAIQRLSLTNSTV